MNKVFALVVLVFALVIVIGVVGQLVKKPASSAKYERRQKLFSDAERSFLGVLDQLFGAQYRIFGKVGLSDILKTQAGLSNSARSSAFNRIRGRHVDFVLCDPSTFEIVATIELDDSSHEAAPRQNRDKFVDQALSSAGVPLIRFKAQRAYNPTEVREKILAAVAVETPVTTAARNKN